MIIHYRHKYCGGAIKVTRNQPWCQRCGDHVCWWIIDDMYIDRIEK